MGRRSVPSKRSAASMRPQGWAVVVWRTGIARKERSDHVVSQAGIWRDLGVLGQVAWEDSPHPAFGGRQVKAVVGVTWQLSYVTSPHMRVTASTRRRTPASIASCHWGRASKRSLPLLVQQYAVRLHREAYHSGLSGQLAQDVGDVVAARGAAVHRHEAPRRADAPGELGEPTHLAGADPGSSRGLLAFLVADRRCRSSHRVTSRSPIRRCQRPRR